MRRSTEGRNRRGLWVAVALLLFLLVSFVRSTSPAQSTSVCGYARVGTTRVTVTNDCTSNAHPNCDPGFPFGGADLGAVAGFFCVSHGSVLVWVPVVS